jgi:ubiquinone/menaquinone biosynthesis C-methylase UbiE
MTVTSRDYFNSQASCWKDHPEDDEQILCHLRSFGIQPGDRILDLGCGTGRLSPLLSQLTGPSGKVVHADYAFDMLRIGRRKNPANQWVCTDAHRLSFRQGCFDKVVCFSTFPHFKNPGAVLREMHRLLLPGGWMLILHTCCSIRLNEMHSQLEPVISGHRLPRARDLEKLVRQLPFRQISFRENPQLYWLSAQKEIGGKNFI